MEHSQYPLDVQLIPITSIHVGAKRKKQFSMDDEKNRMFLESIVRLGLLQPITVRPNAKGFEVVFGRRRLWAAKQCGIEKLPCKVEAWSDNQVLFVAIAENIHRQQLNAAEQAKHHQQLMAEFEKAFGPDLGRAAGGKTRAKTASRSKGGKFAENTENQEVQPATDPGSDAGSETNPEAPPDTSAKSFAGMLSEVTGKHLRHSTDDAKIAKAFSEEELTALGTIRPPLTKEDLLKLASLESEEHRKKAALLKCCNCEMPVDDAIAQSRPDDTPGKPKPEEEESDKDWLEIRCGGIRELLQDHSSFDRSALLYRKDRSERQAHRARSKALVDKYKGTNYSPFVDLMWRSFWVDHPMSWLMCGTCQGQNLDNPNCEECHGCGFKMKYQKPPAKGGK